MSTKKTTGQILREARLKKGLIHKKLAAQTGIFWNTIAKIKRNEQTPKFSTAKKLAQALEIDIRELPIDE